MALHNRTGILRRRFDLPTTVWRLVNANLAPGALTLTLTHSPSDPETYLLERNATVSAPSAETVRGSRGFSHKWYSFCLKLSTGDLWLAAESQALAEEWARYLSESCLHAQPAPVSNKTVSIAAATPTSSKTAAVTPSEKSLRARTIREHMKRSASTVMFDVSTEMAARVHGQWRESQISNGIRIMSEVGRPNDFPCVRCVIALPAKPERVFRCLNDWAALPEWDSIIESTVCVDTSEDMACRTLHVKIGKHRVENSGCCVVLGKRDYVVESTWRKEDDGSFRITEMSPENAEERCPLEPGYSRAKILALTYTITPKRASLDSDEPDAKADEALLQVVMWADPGGWLSKLPKTWSEVWLRSVLLRVVALREALWLENFVNPTVFRSKRMPSSKRTSSQPPTVVSARGSLDSALWRHPDETFKVRSLSYFVDKKKVDDDGTMFDLVAVDLLKSSSGAVDNVAARPSGVAARLNKRPEAPFLFVVSFQVPDVQGMLHFVLYFQAKQPDVFGADSAFARVLKGFVEGDDAYRDARFKICPRVVKGSYIVKSAVGSTPVILGQKLVCSYHRGNNYFEVDVDVSSSSVAGSVLKLVKGYLTTLTIEIAIMIEPHKPEELPESILGAIQFSDLNLDYAVGFD